MLDITENSYNRVYYKQSLLYDDWNLNWLATVLYCSTRNNSLNEYHIQAYMDPSNWGNVPHPLTQLQRQGSWEEKGTTGDSTAVRLVKKHEDVSK